MPIYDFASHQRSGVTQHVEPADVVIIEGILVLHMPEVRELLHMKIFVVRSSPHFWASRLWLNATGAREQQSAFPLSLALPRLSAILLEEVLSCSAEPGKQTLVRSCRTQTTTCAWQEGERVSCPRHMCRNPHSSPAAELFFQCLQ